MNIKYCIECGNILEKNTATKYVCADGHEYFNNPSSAVSIIFINKNNELLFAKRAHDPKQNSYDFPGGFIDYGEDPYQAAVREVKEETGLIIDYSDINIIDLETYEYLPNVTTCDIIFICRSMTGEPNPADDVTSLEWKTADFLLSKKFAWPYKHLYVKLQNELTK